MQILTIILFIIIMIFLLFRKGGLDYFSVALMSYLIYYFPVLIGYLIDPEKGTYNVISSTSYLCIFIFGLSLLFYTLYRDNAAKNNTNEHTIKNADGINRNKTEISNFCVLILTILGILLMLLTVQNYGITGDNFNKMTLLANTNRLTEYMKYIALFTFVYSYVFRGKYIKSNRILSGILIIYTFLLGHRSFIVMGIIAIVLNRLMIKTSNRLISVIGKHKGAFLALLIGALFFVFVKNIFAAYMNGNYNLVKTRLSSSSYYIDTVLESEPNIITNNLNNITVNHFKYSIKDYIFGITGLIPLAGKLVYNETNYISFEQSYNQTFNKRLQQGIGLGSTFIGEAFSVGGILYLIIISLIIFSLINTAMKTLNKTKDPFIYTFMSVILSYLSFYIHRNSLLFLLVTARAYLYILLLLLIVRMVIRKKFIKKK